jgi:hypothetical protein
MNRKVLIISPYFPPSNAADSQRVRMSLPYFAHYGWDAEVVSVKPVFSELPKDPLLLRSIPKAIKVHETGAFSKKWTGRFGLGSLALRSLWFYRQKVSELLRAEKYDLVYFSTTQFPLCILGAYWKKLFGIPYIIDMQDPWHSEYYQDKPREQRPPKYWFSYRLNKFLEPLAMKRVDGLISVSAAYLLDLKARYPALAVIPAETITFGAFAPDLVIAEQEAGRFPLLLDPDSINLVYVGRGGMDMLPAIRPLFIALQRGLDADPGYFSRIRVYFIGTSYAPPGTGRPTILPLAGQLGVASQVVEITDRISYYHTLATLRQADALFIPGSDDPKYTASKIYPYILAEKPLLALFNPGSSAISILQEYGAEYVFSYEQPVGLEEKITRFLLEMRRPDHEKINYSGDALKKYSADTMTGRQCEFFEQVLSNCGLQKTE